MYGEVITFIKPNYIISKKTAKLSGTRDLLQVWGRGNGSWQLQNSCMSDIVLDQASLISTAHLGHGVCAEEWALAPTLARTGFKRGSSGLGSVSSGYTEHSFSLWWTGFASLRFSHSF